MEALRSAGKVRWSQLELIDFENPGEPGAARPPATDEFCWPEGQLPRRRRWSLDQKRSPCQGRACGAAGMAGAQGGAAWCT